jgi:hypothetical protein
MVTRVQKQTVWALQIKNPAEMLEPHLAGKKNQEESKPWDPETPACTKFLHGTLHWENRRAPAQPDAGYKHAWETFSIPIGEHKALHSIPTATPGINQHCPQDRLAPHPSEKNE